MTLGDWFHGACFNLVHHHHLVYNACWEDPRLDRQALNLGPDDNLLVITSAGCNVLDYALQGPRQIHAVDMNPRQNALLELKLAGIRRLEFERFFALFGKGYLADAPQVYRQKLRSELSPGARSFWDRNIGVFAGAHGRKSFYFHGTTGFLAWIMNGYIDWVARVREAICALLSARSLDEQLAIYRETLHAFWKPYLCWAMDRDTTLSLLGVPRAQRQQVERFYPGGVVTFIRDCVEAVFTRLPLRDNYFWRVYLTGRYETDCCPEYLKPANFQLLKNGLMDRISVHTTSILEFLNRHPGRISRFVLLDHMDWLSAAHYPLLVQQWQALIDKAAAGARFLWRSGGMKVDYVDPINVTVQGRTRKVGDLLTYQRDLAEDLHRQDRVHTYGSFYIADLALA